MQKTGNQRHCEGYAAWWEESVRSRVLTARGDWQLLHPRQSSYPGPAGVELDAGKHRVIFLARNDPAHGAAECKLLGFKFHRLANGDQSARQQQTKARRTDVHSVGRRFEGVTQQV